MAELTVARRDVGPGHIEFTRSDGEVFQLVWNARGHASLNSTERPPPDGIDLDVSISDKPARAEELILAYPDGWP